MISQLKKHFLFLARAVLVLGANRAGPGVNTRLTRFLGHVATRVKRHLKKLNKS